MIYSRLDLFIVYTFLRVRLEVTAYDPYLVSSPFIRVSMHTIHPGYHRLGDGLFGMVRH